MNTIVKWLSKCSKNPQLAAQCSECCGASTILDKTGDRFFCLVRLEALIEARPPFDKKSLAETNKALEAFDKDGWGW